MASARSSGSTETSRRPSDRNTLATIASATVAITSLRLEREGRAGSARVIDSARPGGLRVDQSDFRSARAFGRILGREFDPLSLAQQFEDGAANCRSMKEVLDAAFVANKPEALVN